MYWLHRIRTYQKLVSGTCGKEVACTLFYDEIIAVPVQLSYCLDSLVRGTAGVHHNRAALCCNTTRYISKIPNISSAAFKCRLWIDKYQSRNDLNIFKDKNSFPLWFTCLCVSIINITGFIIHSCLSGLSFI